MDEAQDPGWEDGLIDEAIREAERRRAEERDKARRRAVQMAREQAYHRLALAIDRPARRVSPDQLKLFPTDPPTLSTRARSPLGHRRAADPRPSVWTPSVRTLRLRGHA